MKLIQLLSFERGGGKQAAKEITFIREVKSPFPQQLRRWVELTKTRDEMGSREGTWAFARLISHREISVKSRGSGQE